MKILLQLIIIFPIIGYSQKTVNETLKFDKEYFECEDKWIVFPKSEEDSTFTFGFIYLDEQAGFTFNLESEFMIDNSGNFIGNERDSMSNVKIRLEPNTKLVSIIPDNKLSELGLSAEPDWLHFYKTEEGTIKSLVKRGYHYNHVGASNLAIPYLEEAYQKEKDYKGLEFELAYSYNATNKYEKAISVLESAINNDPSNYFYYRELGFSQVRLNMIKEAETTYLTGIQKSDDKYQKSEMAINMTQAFYKLGDKSKFKKWAKLTRKYSDKNSKFLQYIKIWEEELNK